MIPQIKFKLVHADAKLPVRAHETDACFDVVAVSREIKDGFIQYGLGFATELPDGWEGRIYPRSSISEYDLIMCNTPEAKMDMPYRGEWRVRFKQIPKVKQVLLQPGRPGRIQAYENRIVAADKFYEVGDRVAQIQFRKLDQYELVAVNELNDTTRGAGGFGSTGV